MPPKSRKGLFSQKLRGVSLLESLLALSIGGIVIASSMFGASRYSESVQVQASASMLSRLTYAADRYAEDNFDRLVANAPQQLNIDVLEPYFGNNIGSDAFRTDYRLSTRTYNYTVPDPSGGTRQEQALQVLVVGQVDNAGVIPGNDSLRSDVANTAGNGAGFISTNNLTCANASGSGTRPQGHICGAFGTYSFAPNQFPATNFNNVGYVSLVTKGDSSVYGDQLYRYDFGDPELNTMHTDLHMEDNDITDPRRITGVNGIDFDGGSQNITTDSGQLTIQPDGDLYLDPGSNTIEIGDAGGVNNPPVVTGIYNRIQMNEGGTSWVTLGPRVDDDIWQRSGGFHTAEKGTGTLYAGQVNSKIGRYHELNSLHEMPDDPLRLQNFPNGEVVVGSRVRYRPDNGPTYEISDGKIIAQHMAVQDITCADCGGTLANILPRWRHMGTYYVQDLLRRPAGTRVPKPECTDTRRERNWLPSTGEDATFRENFGDGRFERKIIVVPKEIGFRSDDDHDRQAVYSFYATNAGANWVVYPRVYNPSGALNDDLGAATALAATFCVFTGGNPNPVAKSNGNFPTSSSGTFTRVD